MSTLINNQTTKILRFNHAIVDRREILPLPTMDVSEVSVVTGKRARARRARKRRLERCVNGMALSLNALSCGKIGHLPHPEGVSNVGQRLVAQYLAESGELATRTGLLDEGTSVPELHYPYGMETPRMLWLEPDAISLPGDGVAGSACMLSLLPDEIAKNYATAESLLNPETSVLDEPLFRAFLGVRQDKYEALVTLLLSKGIVELQQKEPMVVNGVFAVPKDDKQRLIIDARNANALFRLPPKVDLPSPSYLADLIVEQGSIVQVTKSDMDNFYHRLLMPLWLRQYFGLPSVKWGGEVWWPVVRVLPMGWSHSVFIGQNVHEKLLRVAGLPEELRIGKPLVREVRDFRYGAYIDDYFSLGYDAESAADYLHKVVQTCEDLQLPAKPNKKISVGNPLVEVLGIEVHQNGVLRPVQEKLARLVAFTKAFVKRRKWRTRDLQCVLGRWAWVLLLRRPLFSVLGAAYRDVHRREETIKPSRQSRQELLTLANLSPLIHADMSKTYARVVLCSDASLFAAGVVYKKVESKEVVGNLSKNDFEGQMAWVQSQDWSLAVRHKFNQSGPIHLLEGEAVILALRWVLRNTQNFNQRIMIFVDNQSLIGALTKGRSSKPSFNSICRRVAAITLAGNITVEYHYIKSEFNPADNPSRLV